MKNSASPPNLPARITFLTPGGKRMIEADSLGFQASEGALNNVYIKLEKLKQLMLIARNIGINNEQRFILPYNLPTSEYSMRKLGFDRYQIPKSPLSFPKDLTNGKNGSPSL